MREGLTESPLNPLPMAVSLASMPETFEQWTSWGEVPFASLDGKIQRLGVNLGAPGDRKTDDGTLWLNYPDVGGPGPKLSISTKPFIYFTVSLHLLIMQMI